MAYNLRQLLQNGSELSLSSRRLKPVYVASCLLPKRHGTRRKRQPMARCFLRAVY